MSEASGSDPALGDHLIQVMDLLRRSLIRAARSAGGLSALTEAHATLLRVLIVGGPLSPAQVAAKLRLARPTVSNLVRELTAGGLIERQPSAVDGRSVLLAPTQRARTQLDTFSRGRSMVLACALGEIAADDRDRLAAALPSLSRLLERLETVAEESGTDG
ncbi:DNA-binding MarR family transcriptional regulator [Kibdelosporangium banguiense]|uniref:DNA-binding MarR family transcriptional regulator n=1 Tax=Kibdelosporangium banguiense TaxID=1365924 RepID=A0ABS4TYD3_9PSEU|nr:MarR family transcriptional regulator [Kibdelosporangium banguiense]MBP2329410.1 DNA-binding MarR family transcriptional regulator [Kibdelosporangium banguiense]